MRLFHFFRFLTLFVCTAFATVACEGLGDPDEPYNPPAPKEYTISVSPNGTVTFPAEGGSVEFTVSTNAAHPGCSYPKRDWLSMSYNKESKKFAATVTANDSGSDREFELTFYGYDKDDDNPEVSLVVKGVQKAKEGNDLWITAEPTSLEFSAEGGTLSVVIKGGKDCKRFLATISKDFTGWLSQEWADTDSGNELVYIATPNDTGSDRSATVHVYGGFTDDDTMNAWKGNMDPTRCVVVEITITQPAQSGSNIPEGAASGIFTVNDKGKQIRFSQGNLQYQRSTNTWRFAENQWDYVGCDYYVETGDDYFEWVHTGTVADSHNEGIVESGYTGWIDLFGWGTSGYNKRYPYMSVLNSLKYLTSGKDIAGTKYDWGVNNAISNGGNEAGLWRTLTKGEWEYIIKKRKTNSKVFFAAGTVSGVHGLILLPDDWSQSTYTIHAANELDETSYYENQISAADWTGILEPAGAVFLPCGGSRGNVNYPDEEDNCGGTGPEGYLPFTGCYWSSSVGGYDPSEDYVNSAYMLYFEFSIHSGNRGTARADYGQPLCTGNSVRLVVDK